MKKIFLALIFINTCLFSQTLPEDLEDFTATFSLRSAFNGDLLGISEKNLNLKLRQIELSDELAKIDPLSKLFKLGLVQFTSANYDDLCLAIFPDGNFGGKSCKDDLENKSYETLFSIIPTNVGSVQIRSLVLNKDECISVFDNPRLPSGQGFGLNACDFDRLFDIDLRNLFLILPPLQEADVLN
ncbi:RICIN domain-containing protein [Campylobacter canadensis]|uniref:Toxin n=1 Tax=Campylobacter canadensis TaxID=449520 RepID=A0ABS7WTI6_9BACT|nr:toxin [Campylobacter canadensis]MBZ7988098.1 toxin [Campylobacter canadensis]MBZ7995548.1 toxin [Campylobacter canadensis]MBZ7997345.1 toxin [Campylobacter canadensis]MBZ7999073.1 toxin [Campylobacter canadensis]MBZ8000888.1 toxin [Campylobacter canadensis]